MITRGTWSARKLRISQFLSSLSLCCCVKLFLLKGMASVLGKAKAMVHACGSTGQGASHPSILTEQVDLQISAQEKSWKLWPLNVMAQHTFSQNNRVVSKSLAGVPAAVAVCDTFCSWVACLSEVLDRYFKAWHEGGFVAMLCVCCSLLPQVNGWVAFWWVNQGRYWSDVSNILQEVSRGYKSVLSFLYCPSETKTEPSTMKCQI